LHWLPAAWALRVLIEVASQINPRRMSDTMAQMQPEAAERLTIELAAVSPLTPMGGASTRDSANARRSTS
jgi:flagellar motility protein MotE (MotC chaperone)